MQEDGNWTSSIATWTFEYILDGHGVQDYWVNPADIKTDPDSKDYLGTNIRIYNPKEQKWQCAWVENNTNSMRAIWHVHED